MNERNSHEMNKLKIIAALVFLLLGLIVVVPMTFAWLDVSRVPFVSDMDISVVAENGLMIAEDMGGQPGEWKMYLDASPYLDVMVPLQPVTWCDGQLQKLKYGLSGRSSGVEPLTPENINVFYPEDLSSPEAEEARKRGYTVYIDYWLKAEGAKTDVYLTSPAETENGLENGTYLVGLPVWNEAENKHDNGAYGSETTLRMGLQIWEAHMEPKDDDEYDEASDEPQFKAVIDDENAYDFFIYEPNADIHPDAANGYVTTTAIGTNQPLVDADHLILQNASTWTERDPVAKSEVEYKMGEFITNPKLFTITRNNLFKVRMWIWMEGQDIDCSALNVVEESSAIANIAFGVKAVEEAPEVQRGE